MSLIKDEMWLIIAYSVATFLLMFVAFRAGNDLGYTKGLSAGTTAEYVNGVQDGVSSCIDAVMKGNKRYSILDDDNTNNGQSL